MEIREAVQDDFEGICQLITSEEELFLVYPKGTYPLNLKQLEHLTEVRQNLTVATERLQVVGFSNLYDFAPGRHAFIGNLIVDKDFRKQAIGKKMVNHMLGLIFHQHDLPEARISVFIDNIPAFNLYSGFGFRPFETTDLKNFKDERVDLLHMKLSRAEYQAQKSSF